MPDTETAELVDSAVNQVLETMFFSGVMSVIEEPDDTIEQTVSVRIAFRGRPSGSMALRLSTGAARTITANFLGQEDEKELESAQVGDTVCELANMICGSVLSRLENETSFELDRAQLIPEAEWARAAGTVRQYELENGVLAIALSLEAES